MSHHWAVCMCLPSTCTNVLYNPRQLDGAALVPSVRWLVQRVQKRNSMSACQANCMSIGVQYEWPKQLAMGRGEGQRVD